MSDTATDIDTTILESLDFEVPCDGVPPWPQHGYPEVNCENAATWLFILNCGCSRYRCDQCRDEGHARRDGQTVIFCVTCDKVASRIIFEERIK